MKRRPANTALIISAFFFFVLFVARLSSASLFKVLWDDETVGMRQSYVRSYGNLLWVGSEEASPSPLYYLLNKIWHGLWNYTPQEYWNLHLFMRLPHVIYFALGSLGVFFWIAKAVREKLALSLPLILIIAGGAAFFFHTNNFTSYYAIEDRAYSLWLMLSTFQFLAFLDWLFFGFSKRSAVLFGMLSVLLVFTTFSSLPMTAAQLGLYWLFFKRDKKFFSFSALVLGTSSLVALWYFRSITSMDYGIGWFTWKNYFGSITEVVAKTYHHHNAVALAFSLPITFLSVIFLWKKYNSRIPLALFGYAALCLCVTFILFKGSEWKHGIWASRYIIFLVPPFTALYGLVLYAIANLFRGYGKYVFVLWCAIQLFPGIFQYVQQAKKDFGSYKAEAIYGRSTRPECTHRFSEDGAGEDFLAKNVERVNSICRGLL